MSNFCQRCGSEDALNVQSIKIYGLRDGEVLNLCEFCRTIPSGIFSSSDGLAYSIVGNILASLIKSK